MTYKINLTCRKFTLAEGFMLLCLISKSQNNFRAVDQMPSDYQKSWLNAEMGSMIHALTLKY
jgi:hypothetical protein